MTKTANNRTVLGGSTYPINVSDSFINCYATAAITLILPPRSSVNSQYFLGINDILNAFGTFNVTLQCSGSDTINGANSLILAINGTAVVIEVSGNTNYVASGLGSGSVPPTSNPLISKTYAELSVMVGASTLVPGQAYLITDFATKHIIPQTIVENIGVTEPIIITAETTTTFYCNAISTLFPQDIINYEFVDSTTAGGDKGRIYFRKDTQKLVSTGYDWRNVKFRRWQYQQIDYIVNVGIFTYNETVTGGTSGATGRMISTDGTRIVLQLQQGTFVVGETVTGGVSAATCEIFSITDNGIFNNFLDNGSAPQDQYTFGNDPAANGFYDTKLGSITDYGIAAFGAPSSKLNNIVFGTSGQYIKIASDCFNSTFGNGTEVLEIAEGFNNNVIGNASSVNKLGKGFANNIVDTTFVNNTIGFSAYNNLFKSTFSNNIIGAESSGNVFFDICSGNVFGNTLQNNFFGSQCINNSFGNTTSGNRFGGFFTSNICGIGFSTNVIGDFADSNNFGSDFLNNIIGDNFADNIIGTKSNDNTIGNGAAKNIIGSGFKKNTIGVDFLWNRIGANFGSTFGNVIGSNFERNLIGADFDHNVIGTSFISNNLNDSFKQNTIGNGFTLCNIITFLTGIDFSAATIVYGNYSKTITRDNGPANKVVYLDNATGLYVAAAVNS